MSIKRYIPTSLEAEEHVGRFVSLLDALNAEKTETISASLRVNNPVLNMDKKWLLKKLSNFGLLGFSLDFPIAVLQQVYLNANMYTALRGSKKGLEFYLSILTLGDVTIDDRAVLGKYLYVSLDDLKQGYLTDSTDDPPLYLVDDSDILAPFQALIIDVKSKYFNGEYPIEEGAIKAFINKDIRNQLKFSPNMDIDISFSSSDNFHFHNLLNNFFV